MITKKTVSIPLKLLLIAQPGLLTQKKRLFEKIALMKREYEEHTVFIQTTQQTEEYPAEENHEDITAVRCINPITDKYHNFLLEKVKEDMVQLEKQISELEKELFEVNFLYQYIQLRRRKYSPKLIDVVRLALSCSSSPLSAKQIAERIFGFVRHAVFRTLHANVSSGLRPLVQKGKVQRIDSEIGPIKYALVD